jgi:hypothetical protein
MLKSALNSEVLNRGVAPAKFLEEIIEVVKKADEWIFAVNHNKDIYTKVRPELGPYESLLHRKAIMIEVLRVLALFESSCDWTEGVDTSKLEKDTPENAEAGAWQISYNSRHFSPKLQSMCDEKGIDNGLKFQRSMKFDHKFAILYVMILLRFTTRHNGPLYKGEERAIIRKSLRGAEHSIYPWLHRDCVQEFMGALS